MVQRWELAEFEWPDVLTKALKEDGHYQLWLYADPVPLSFTSALSGAAWPLWVTLTLEQGVPMDVRLAAIVAVMEVPDAE